jgi:hypothetical protein
MNSSSEHASSLRGALSPASARQRGGCKYIFFVAQAADCLHIMINTLRGSGSSSAAASGVNARLLLEVREVVSQFA